MEIAPDWRTSVSEDQAIIERVQIRVDNRAAGALAEARIEERRDDMEYGWSSVETELDLVGVDVLIGVARGAGPPSWWIQWEGVNIGGRIRLLSFRDDAYWQETWAKFGYTNTKSAVGGYWRHTVGLVASGIAAIAKDEDEEWRVVHLLAVDEDDPSAVGALSATSSSISATKPGSRES